MNKYLLCSLKNSYCNNKKVDLISHAKTWLKKWGTATTDPGGQIRTEGRQLSSDMGQLLADCNTVLNDHDKLTLTQMRDLIAYQLDRDINIGPPCNPSCQPGPPIS